MKVLLISINDDASPLPAVPIALAVLKPILVEAGFECETLDLFYEDDRPAVIRATLERFQPEIVGVSIKYLAFSGSRSKSTPEEITKLTVDTVRDASDATIVLGGAGFSSAPEFWLAATEAPFGIAGDGELSLLDFVRCLERDIDPRESAVGGLVYRTDDGGYHREHIRPVQDLTTLPIPDRSVFDERYTVPRGIIAVNGIQTCRGCSKHCIMCSIHLSEGTCERTSDPEHIVAQIKQDEANGFDGFYIADTIFNRPTEHAHAMVDAFIAHGIKGPWGAAVTPEGLGLDLLKKMKQTGCRTLTIGVDAAEPSMIESLRKDFTVDDVKQAVADCREADIISTLTLWLGGPGESMETIEYAFDLVDTAEPDVLLVFHGVQIYPRTQLAKIGKREGYFEDPLELMRPTYYESPELPLADFMAWYKNRYKKMKRIIVRGGERESISLHPPSGNKIAPLIFGGAKAAAASK